MRYIKFLQFICCIVLMGITNYAQATIYNVTPTDFATKLRDAVAGDVFNLAAGTYKPAYRADGSTPTSTSQWRQATFYVKVGVTIKGTGTVILSGDVNTTGTATDNVYHVVTIANSLISTSVYTLDNITIQDGYGNGGGTNSQGAGVFVGSGAKVKFNQITVQNNRTNWHGCGMFVNTGAEVTFDDANSFLNNTYISGDVWGGGLSVWDGATCTFTGNATFMGNTANHGGGLHLYRGKVNIPIATFTSNTAVSGHGGAVDSYYYSDFKITISASFNNNTSGTWGGGIHNDYYSTLELNNATFLSNTAGHGGGFHNTEHSTAVFRGCTFDRNEATSGHGGAIDNYATSSLTMYNCDIINNKALASWGGGIHNDASATLLFRTGKITGNSAAHGGGVHNTSSTANLYNVKIMQNNATVHGGGINHWGGTMSVDSCTISANSVVGYGGGVHVESGNFNMRRSAVYSNSATIDGGGLYIIAPTYIANSTISDNRAGSYGGGMGIGATTTLINNTIVYNTTDRTTNTYGAGLYIGVYPTMVNNLISGNTRSGGVENNLSRANLNTNAKFNIIGSSFYPVNSLVPQPNTVFTIGSHLASLADNSPGVTATHALIGTANPAATLGSPTVLTNADGSLKFDQRGVARKSPSIGAYEAGATPSSDLVAYDDYVTITNTDPFVFDVLQNDYINIECNNATIIWVPDPATNNTTQGTAGRIYIDGKEQLQYLPKANFVYDVVEYYFECSGRVSNTAKLYIKIKNFPDNVVEAGCTGTVPSTTWGINPTPLKSVVADLSCFTPILVGDLDGNGKPELVATGSLSTDLAQRSQSFYIFKDGNIADSNPVKVTTPSPFWIRTTPMAIAKINGIGVIFIALEDDYLYAYKMDGTPYWSGGKSNATWINTADKVAGKDYLPFVGITDFNGDGLEEVYVGNRIFDARTGKLLLTVGGVGGNKGALVGAVPHRLFSIAADVTGDGYVDLIAGNKVYNISSLADRSNPANNTYTVAYTATLPAPSWGGAITDGYAQVADFNNDGNLDVLVTQINSSNKVYFAAYSPSTNKILGSFEYQGIAPLSSNGPGMPFIGDIDGDKIVEVIFTSPLHLIAYDFNNTATPSFSFKWDLPTSDNSGCTGVTLFDFNQDGKTELVYRDQTHLRILDGTNATTIQTNLAQFESNSATVMEYPVIADYDGDGHADILIVSGEKTPGDNANTMFGNITIYKGLNNDWAPARKVWNQYGYNAVNVNNDLTIPRIQYNPATRFPGPNEILGDADDVRPYNGFLMQQTTLSENGIPLWPLPNAQWNVNPTYKYYAEGDSLVITASIKNIGDAALTGICVTAYKNEALTANKLVTGCYNKPINPGANATFTFRLINASTYIIPGFDYLILRLNDDGISFPAQAVCDMVGSEFIQPLLAIPMAQNDRITVFRNSTTNINVLANDNLGTCSDLVPVIITQAKHGNAVVGGEQITYTPNSNYVGNDTVKYQITCGDDVSEAYVYITVVPYPDNITEEDCAVTPEATEWGFNQTFTSDHLLNSLLAPVVGDLNNDGIPEILALNFAGANSDYTANAFYVFYGTDRSNPRKIDVKDGTGTIKTVWGRSIGGMAIAKIKIGSVDKAIVIIACSDNKLRAYDPSKPAGTEFLWESNSTVTSLTTGQVPVSVHIADFDNDGNTEVYTSDRIFNAATGTLLVAGTGNKGRWDVIYSTITMNYHFSHAADMDSDGKLELLVGTQVYKVNIPNKTGIAGNSLNSDKSIPDVVINGKTFKDGATFAVDINQDGKLDIVCRSVIGKDIGLFVWDYASQKLIASQTFVDDQVSGTNPGQAGIPFVGDVDADKNLELLLVTTNRLRVFDIVADKFVQRIAYPIRDASGSTGITLFDFNQDGKSELVYRDEQKLRIMNAGATKLEVLDSIECASLTVFEYPLIADVNNDGHAEIVVIGNTDGVTANKAGALYIIESKSLGSWAPARPVWNQYAYNAVNVNNDLSIPQYQMSPAMVFAGVDGVLGTDDDVRPYNAFLQQQTTLGKNGVPVFTTPDYVILPDWTVVGYAQGDSAVISFKIKNQGAVQGAAPLYVSAYKDAPSVGTLLVTKAYQQVPDKNVTLSYTITIRNISTLLTNSITLVVNNKGEFDGGDIVYVTPECAYEAPITVPVSSLLILFEDYGKGFSGDKLVIDVLANDILASCGRAGVTPSIVSGPNPLKGSITWVNKDLEYTSKPGFVGRDTLTYSVTCAGVTATKKVFVRILEKPAIILMDSCSFAPYLLLDPQYSGSTYAWERSDDGISGWVPAVGVSGTYGDRIGTPTEGYYRVKITYPDVPPSYSTVRKVSIIKQFKHPSGKIWYEMHLQ